MPEARKLKGGRWRIYDGPHLEPARDPRTGAIVIFEALEAARCWWDRHHPAEAPLQEAIKCAWCGAYFGPLSGHTTYSGRHYHPQHTRQAMEIQRRQQAFHADG